MLESLDADFREKLNLLRESCLKHGITLRIARGFVNVFEHAEIWRASHTSTEIDMAISELQREGCNFLASTMMHCHACASVPGMKRAPGMSWHNFGKAVDVQLVNREGKKLHHDLKEPLFATFMELLDDSGLVINHAACDFDGFHIQAVHAEAPSDVYSPEAIDNEIYRSYRNDHNQL